MIMSTIVVVEGRSVLFCIFISRSAGWNIMCNDCCRNPDDLYDVSKYSKERDHS